MKLRALPWDLLGNGLNAIFGLWTFAGSLFVLFLNELGLPKGQIGVLLSLMPFCGVLALFFAPVAARIGRKRVFLFCYGMRKPVMALLLLLPWVISGFGRTAAFVFLVAVLAVFAVLRALAETALFPWMQEFVPDRVRGRYGGMSILVGVVASGTALWVAGQVIERGEGLPPYLVLIGAGSVLGFLGVLVKARVPGGRPLPDAPRGRQHLGAMLSAIRDRNLQSYLGGLAGFTVGTMMLIAFLPLYVREQIGLPAETVVRLDLAIVGGSAVSSLAWGWLADRRGSRAALLPAMLLLTLLPGGWLLLPRDLPHPVLWCAGLYLLFGIARAGAMVGAGRLLFNQVVPPARSTAYLGLYYACLGLTGGIGPLLAGGILNAWGERQVHLFGLNLSGYPVFFAVALACVAAGTLLYRRIVPEPDDDDGGEPM